MEGASNQAAAVGVEPIGGQRNGRRRSSGSETIDAVMGALRRSSNSFTKAKAALTPGEDRLLEAAFIKAPVKGKLGRHKRRHMVLCNDRIQWYASADAAAPKGELLINGTTTYVHSEGSLTIHSSGNKLVLKETNAGDARVWSQRLRQVVHESRKLSKGAWSGSPAPAPANASQGSNGTPVDISDTLSATPVAASSAAAASSSLDPGSSRDSGSHGGGGKEPLPHSAAASASPQPAAPPPAAPTPASAPAPAPSRESDIASDRSSRTTGRRSILAAKKKVHKEVAAGSRVRLKDIVSKPELNGQEGVVISLGERNLVLIDGSSTPIALKPANMYPIGAGQRRQTMDSEAKDEPPDPWLLSQQQEQQQQPQQ